MFSSYSSLLYQAAHCHSINFVRGTATPKLISFKTSPFLLKLLVCPPSSAAISLTAFHLIASLPSLALDNVAPPPELVSDKVTLESILGSIDEFFNKNPFFVAGCAFIWLVVIPLTEEYLRKYKYVSAIDGYKKVKDDPNAQLVDIRDNKSVVALPSPDLTVLNKSVIQIEFDEDNEGEFVRRVVKSFEDPKSTVLCLTDNFDGNSLRAAELLFKEGGFKEAYALKGGIRGKNGWLAIQDTLLPTSVHMNPTKKKKKMMASQAVESVNNGMSTEEQGVVSAPRLADKEAKISSRSPYPNYPELKPPSSPSPRKPGH